jgi:hypothetical protein
VLLVVLLASFGLTLTASTSAHADAGRYRITAFHPERTDRAALVREWRVWKRHGIGAYSTTVSRGCFCPSEAPIVTDVRRHRVTSVHFAGTTDEVTGHGYEVEHLFRVLRRAYRTADVVTVHWTRRGVPRSIYVDPSRMVADDEYTLTVRLRPAS